ncbi:glycosyltransferase family 2 protein [Calothrix sp. 336/3]|uniref:glycosyltransferase family 2 protein n=1 Tax=Calothrix sp. 336/3 TaxID=1337936 RepID=UPI0005563386|nr:glycosyltransferase family 2 protein [Calothrix sp. 336/3]AKG23278.1 hypothetical protein IJ00_20120 [Calothrix sp. 336/3]
MSRLLTIAIPTYNRADLLDTQLAWLSHAIKGYESDCEILISDNCSTDSTPEVIQKWRSQLTNIKFTAHRNSQNLGVMRNLVHCLKSAETKYVWAIGDDDPIDDKAIPYVISNLKSNYDLSLLILNFSLRDTHTNQVLYHHTFDVKTELLPDGKNFIENYLTKEHRGLGFLSAQIYHTATVQQALKSWPASVDNLEGQIYWGAFCAQFGRVHISKKVYLENARVMYKPRVRVRMHFIDLPQVFIRLITIGYNRIAFHKRVIEHYGKKGFGKVIQPLLRLFPEFTVNFIIPQLVYIASYIVPIRKEV